MNNNKKGSPRLAYGGPGPRGSPMIRGPPGPRGTPGGRQRPSMGRPTMGGGWNNGRPSMSNSPRMSRPSFGYGGRGPRMVAPPGGHRGPPLNSVPLHPGPSYGKRRRPDGGPPMEERLSIRPRYGYGGHSMPGPSPTPSPRDGPGLTPRHPSFTLEGSTGQPSAPRFPPRPPAPPKPPQNTKKNELLSSIEEIDLKIAQKEQQLEAAQENKNLLERSMSTGTSVRELTRNDSDAGSDVSSSLSSSLSSSSSSSSSSTTTNITKKDVGGFVNDLTPTKLTLSEIVANTIRANRQRAFASRAMLTKFVDDGTESISRTVRGLPTLARIKETCINSKAIEWTSLDEQSMPLYSTPQESPTFADVLSTHEKNKRMVTEAVSIRKSTTAKFSKAVAAKYHQHYLEWQERLRKVTQGSKRGASRDSRRRERAQQMDIDDGLDHDHQRSYIADLMVQDEDFYSSTLADVPKMIIGKRTREETGLAKNNNSRIWNPAQLEHDNLLRNPWSNTEKIIFLAKFLEYPKEFWKIATYLTNKTTNDCIAFYYRIKKRIDLKALLKKQSVLRNAHRSNRNKDPNQARDEERFGDAYIDSKGNVKQQSLLQASMWSVLVDAAAALDVEVPIQLVDPYEDDVGTDSRPRCMPLSSQLSNVFYTDWPEDHWTRFRSSPRALGHFAQLKKLEKEYETTGISRISSLKQEEFHTNESVTPMNNYSQYRLIQASRLASKRSTEPEPMDRYLSWLENEADHQKSATTKNNHNSSSSSSSTSSTSSSSSSSSSGNTSKKKTRKKSKKSEQETTSARAAPKADRQQQKWTDQEKKTYLTCLRKYGKTWSKFEEKIPNKTLAQIRNFFQN